MFKKVIALFAIGVGALACSGSGNDPTSSSGEELQFSRTVATIHNDGSIDQKVIKITASQSIHDHMIAAGNASMETIVDDTGNCQTGDTLIFDANGETGDILCVHADSSSQQCAQLSSFTRLYRCGLFFCTGNWADHAYSMTTGNQSGSVDNPTVSCENDWSPGNCGGTGTPSCNLSCNNITTGLTLNGHSNAC